MNMNGSYDFILKSSNETNTTNRVPDLSEDESSSQWSISVRIILIIAGTIGNLFVCLAILLDRKLQNLTNYFLLSLAVTDLLISLLILPATLMPSQYEFEPSTFPLCFLYLVGDDFLMRASAIHICFISCERYLAIRNPLNQRNLTKRRVVVKIGLVWFIAFLTIIPYMTDAIITTHAKGPMRCPELLSYFTYFDVIILIANFVTVVMIVIVVVSLVLTTILLQKLVNKQKKNMAPGNSGLVRTVGGNTNDETSKNKKPFQVLQSEQKALRVIWLLTFAFVICWAPLTGLIIIYFHFPKIIIPEVFFDLATFLYYFYPVLNPIVYTIFNKTFRDDFKNLIRFKFKKFK